MKWYQNKYAQAALVAFVTGFIAACTVYAGTMTDGLDMRHTVKVVALAFLAPFSILVSVLPKITDLITPTVRIVSQLPIAAAAPAPHAEQEVVTTGAETVVTVTPDAPRPEQSTDRVAAAVQRDRAGRFAPRVIPPVPPV